MANPQDTPHARSAYHRAVWGSLAAKLEAECEEVWSGPRPEADRGGGGGVDGSFGGGDGRGGRRWRMDGGRWLPESEAGGDGDVGPRGGQLERRRRPNSNEVPLKRWMRGALNSSSASSSAYLQASLKIAAGLAKQLADAEADGGSGGLDAFSTEGDWIDRVWVELGDEKGGDDAGDDANSPVDAGSNGGNGNCDAAQEQDMNRQLEAFLESFGVDDFENADHDDEWLSRPLPPLPGLDLDVGRDEASSVDGAALGPSPLPPSPPSDEAGGGRDYLNVRSAELARPPSPRRGGASDADERLRIFRLGALFRRLFSGGTEVHLEVAEPASPRGAPVPPPAPSPSDGGRGRDRDRDRGKRRALAGPRPSPRGALRRTGLPGPLRDLVSDMLGSVRGDPDGGARVAAADVRSDLEAMARRPRRFLRDSDLGELSLRGLRLEDTEFSREEELASIRACYRRSVSGSPEAAVVVGLSGTGKTWLAERVGRFVGAEGGLFLTGKFDRLGTVAPFSVLASAFDQYCDALAGEGGARWAPSVAGELRRVLGRDARHLVRVVPKLGWILPGATAEAAECDADSSTRTLQRLCYLLCQFVEVITAHTPVASVTLCLDDVQWCDEATVLVLNQLLMKGHKKFFFVGCLRIDEMNDHHIFWKMIQNVRSFGVDATTVKLDCMDKETMNEMVSDLLCLPPRRVRSLSDMVFTKTLGCPLFFSQLMLSLNRDGLLRPSLTEQRWVWDEEEILCMKLPENVAVCVTDGISKLPIDVQMALRTLALFGASARCDYMKELQSQLSMKLIEHLDVAASEGLLTNVKGSYHFSHDRIQEAVYGIIDEEARRRDHSLYGLCLVKSALESGNDDMLFVAVNQINLGGPSAVLETAELVAMTKYNLIAGKRAIELSDFSSACSFFSNGMRFLPSNHWIEHYHLSLELFELASKSALATGNIQSLQVLSGEVLKRARCFEDKLNVYYTVLSSLVQSSLVVEALEKSREILSRLGEGIPSTISHDALVQYTHQTQSMIRGITENDFLNYRLMTDSNKLTTMKFMAKTESITPMVKPELHHYVTMKMVQLTITHGLSPMTPVAFAYFGSMLAKRGNIRVGYRFTLLAKALLDKLDSREIAGEVMSVVTEAQSYVEPIQALNELWVKGETTAMAAGDTLFACINRVQHCSMLFWTGVKLSTVREEFVKAIRFMKEQSHTTSLFFMQTLQNTMLALAGSGSESRTDDAIPKRVRISERNPHERMILSFQKLYTAFILNNGDLKQCAEKFLESKELSLFLISGDASQVFIVGLACYQIYHETRDPLWAERGRKCKEKVKTWSQQGSPWNFQHKAELLEAEGRYCCGNFEGAKESYKKAIQLAQSHKFINDEALAWELAANFYLEMGDSIASMEHYTHAHKKYCDWGACAKAAKLFERINGNFSGVLMENFTLSPSFDGNFSTTEEYSNGFDTRKRREM